MISRIFLEGFSALDESPTAQDDFEDQFVDFSNETDETEDEEINRFFSDPFDEDGEEIEFDQNVENEVAESLGMDADSDEEITATQAEVAKSLGINLNTDMHMDDDELETADSFEMDFKPDIDSSEDEPEDETSDFKLDTDIIAGKKEELGTILSDDDDDIATTALGILTHDDEAEPEDSEAEAEAADIGTISSRQIEEAVERLIKNNYADKIESIIVSVIEQAVSKEIEKLKDALLRDISDSD